MNEMTISMALVSECNVGECGYNKDSHCHAKAITIGDLSTSKCNTFMDSISHDVDPSIRAGVGACKTNSCEHNQNFECTSDQVSVGMINYVVNCLTFKPKTIDLLTN